MRKSKFTFNYAIDGTSETLKVKKYEYSTVIDRNYENGYCLIDLVFDQNIVPISNEIKVRVQRFKVLYREYCRSKNYDLISDIIIHASTDRMTIGKIVKGIPTTFTTSDINKLVDFIIVHIYKNDFLPLR
jgi:hypothetical protein